MGPPVVERTNDESNFDENAHKISYILINALLRSILKMNSLGMLGRDVSTLYSVERYVRVHFGLTFRVLWRIKREQRGLLYEINYQERILKKCADQWKMLYNTVRKMARLPSMALYQSFAVQLLNLKRQLSWQKNVEYPGSKSYIRLCSYAISRLWNLWYSMTTLN